MKIILPVLLLLFGIIAAYALLASQPVLTLEQPTVQIPAVTALSAEPQTLQLSVASQGVVKPRYELELSTEVAGKILYLHPNLVTGGFFHKDELLVRIDTSDYDTAIVQAQAQITEAKRLLATELAQAEQARTEWQALGHGQASALVMREPQLAEARAKLKAAESVLLQVKNKRERCEIHAPFTGRVASKNATVGQMIHTGDKLARLYGTEVLEVRLPIALEQLAYLDISLSNTPQKPINVALTASLAGAIQTWQARIVRTEGMVDDNMGVLYLVAELRAKPDASLLNGLFVQADIQGKILNDIFVLPPQAISATHKVLIVDKDQHLHSRQLEVLRSEENRILIQHGLQAGERVVTSGVDVAIENMAVQVLGDAHTP